MRASATPTSRSEKFPTNVFAQEIRMTLSLIYIKLSIIVFGVCFTAWLRMQRYSRLGVSFMHDGLASVTPPLIHHPAALCSLN